MLDGGHGWGDSHIDCTHYWSLVSNHTTMSDVGSGVELDLCVGSISYQSIKQGKK